MCSVQAAQLTIAVVSAVASYSSQKSAAAAQEAMIRDGYAQEPAQTRRQYEQINEASAEDKSQSYKQHLIDQGHLRAVAAESGLFGATQDRADGLEQATADQDIATLEANRRRQTEQVHSQGVGQMSRANVQLAGIRRPSLIGAGLQIAGAAVPVVYPPKKEG